MQKKPVYDRIVFYSGDEVFAEGDEANWAYLIQSGKIEIVKKHGDGTAQRLALLGPGRIFGEMSLIDNLPRSASARAVTETVLILINNETLLQKISKSDPLVQELLRNLTMAVRSNGRRSAGQT